MQIALSGILLAPLHNTAVSMLPVFFLPASHNIHREEAIPNGRFVKESCISMGKKRQRKEWSGGAVLGLASPELVNSHFFERYGETLPESFWSLLYFLVDIFSCLFKHPIKLSVGGFTVANRGRGSF